MSRRRKKTFKFQGLYFITGFLCVLSLAAVILVAVLAVREWKDRRESPSASVRQEEEESETWTSLPQEAWSQDSEDSAETSDSSEEKSVLLESIQGLKAGTELSEEQIDGENLARYFTSEEISDTIYQRIYGVSYREDCTVPREDLRYLKVLHYGFKHEIRVGELIVNAALADDFLNIFQELYEEEYEIEKMYLVDNYNADDTASIDDNNTSCFNYREVTGGSSLSNHATGCAIDINPQQNPYVTYDDDGSPVWQHSNADAYIDRDGDGDHMIDHEDTCYKIFEKYGFSWGGDWNSLKDYQHFEKEVVSY